MNFRGGADAQGRGNVHGENFLQKPKGVLLNLGEGTPQILAPTHARYTAVDPEHFVPPAGFEPMTSD